MTEQNLTPDEIDDHGDKREDEDDDDVEGHGYKR